MSNLTEMETEEDKSCKVNQIRAIDVGKLLVKVTFYCFKSLLLYLCPKTQKDITGDVVLITGGGRGIGRQLAIEFAKHKPKHVILWGRTEAPLKEASLAIQDLGVDCTYMICDVSCKKQIFEKAVQIKNDIGDVTILVNNAGIVTGKKIVETNEEEIRATIAVNTMAHLWTIKAFLPGMVDKQMGHIVTVNSTLGMLAMSGLGDYCTSKYAATGMSEALLWELEEYPNINISSIHSYMVANKMFSGLKLRFPWLIPILSEVYVAKKTVDAVLTNQSRVIMPRIMYPILLSHRLFPESVLLPVYRFLGTDTAMDNFHKAS